MELQLTRKTRYDFMKYGLVVLATLLLVSLSFNYLLKVERDQLKAQISAFKEKTDTVIVKGKPDTVKVLRVTKVYVEIPKDKAIQIDTTLFINDHEIAIKTDGSKLLVNIECRRPDFVVSQTDTVKVPVMVEVQLPPKPIPFYEKKEVWFVAGVAVTYAILKLVSK